MGTKPEDLAAHYAKKYPLTFTEDCPDGSLAERYRDAWDVAEKAAQLLKNEYDAKRIVVFGSLAHRSWFTRWSDIDLAAWDIPDDRFYAAVGVVTGLSARFKVDLVDAASCQSSLRKAIEDEGIGI